MAGRSPWGGGGAGGDGGARERACVTAASGRCTARERSDRRVVRVAGAEPGRGLPGVEHGDAGRVAQAARWLRAGAGDRRALLGADPGTARYVLPEWDPARLLRRRFRAGPAEAR